MWCSTNIPASTINLDAYVLRDWVNRALRANLTYFRVRRELFEHFNAALDAPIVTGCEIENEDYMILRQFLTQRNDSLDDNKRLSFDKALDGFRAAASSAITRSEAAHARVPARAPGS